MRRSITLVTADGAHHSFQVNAEGQDPKSSQYSDYAIAKEFAKRYPRVAGEQIIVSGSKFSVQADGSLKPEA